MSAVEQFHLFSHFLLLTLWDKHYLTLAGKDLEIWRGWVICLKLYSCWGAGLKFEASCRFLPHSQSQLGAVLDTAEPVKDWLCLGLYQFSQELIKRYPNGIFFYVSESPNVTYSLQESTQQVKLLSM